MLACKHSREANTRVEVEVVVVVRGLVPAATESATVRPLVNSAAPSALMSAAPDA